MRPILTSETKSNEIEPKPTYSTKVRTMNPTKLKFRRIQILVSRQNYGQQVFRCVFNVCVDTDDHCTIDITTCLCSDIHIG